MKISDEEFDELMFKASREMEIEKIARDAAREVLAEIMRLEKENG